MSINIINSIKLVSSIAILIILPCCTSHRADKINLTVKFDGAILNVDSAIRKISEEINAKYSYSDFNGTSEKYYIIYNDMVNIIIVPIPDNNCMINSKDSYHKKIYRFDIVPISKKSGLAKSISKKIIHISRDINSEIHIGGENC